MDYTHLDDREKLGEYVRHYRQQQNLTQVELARLSGASRYAISMLETQNKVPSLDVMMNIAECISMPIPFIFKSSEMVTLKEYIVGKTTLSSDGSVLNFSMVQIPADFIYNYSFKICVRYNNKRYIADKNSKTKGTYFLCADKVSGQLYVASKKQIQQDKNHNIIARIIKRDITGITQNIEF